MRSLHRQWFRLRIAVRGLKASSPPAETPGFPPLKKPTWICAKAFSSAQQPSTSRRFNHQQHVSTDSRSFTPSSLEKYLFSSFLRSLALLFLEKNFRTVFLSSFWLFLFKGEETKCRVGSLLGFSNCNGDFRRGKCASGEKRSSREIIWNMCARICFREEKKLLIKARESFRLIEFCLIFYGERGKRFFLSSVWGQGSDVFSIKIYTWTLTVDININFEFQLLKLNENVARFCFFEFKFKTSPLPLSPSPPKIQI